MGDELGRALEKLREQQGLSRYQLAQQSGVKWDNIKAIEEGTSGGNVNTVEALCSTLGAELSITVSGKPVKWNG